MLRFPAKHRAAAALAALLASAALPASAAATTRTLSPTDDAWVGRGAIAGGTSTRLRVSRHPRRVSYLKFALGDLPAPPRSATLVLTVVSRSRHASVDVWSTSSRDWSGPLAKPGAMPRLRTRIGHVGRLRTGHVRIPLGAAIKQGGSQTLALTVHRGGRAAFAAVEAGRQVAPHLLLDVPAAAVPTPPAPSPAPEPAWTRPPGSPPLADSAAAAHVRPAGEIRPANATANGTVPTDQQLAAFRSASDQPYSDHVTGDFTGTTDEIIQWAAWKWGVDEDLLRAVATQESDWRQGFVGDGGVSFGLFQVKTQLAGSDGWPGTYPLARDSTAFNADYYGRAFRSCFDGRETWLGGSYGPGDVWGCVGFWYSGAWHQAESEWYVNDVADHLQRKPWAQPGY